MSQEPQFLLPESITRPLWKDLPIQARDYFFPEKLPPLQLTSRPANIGMLTGDRVSLPWFRTIFTNLGDVINPETLPPLELQSRPVDTGELISDMIGHPWFHSMLRNLADVVSPERMPALELTSAPANASLEAGTLQVLRWSSLIPWAEAPARAAKAETRPAASLPAPVRTVQREMPPNPVEAEHSDHHQHGRKLIDALSWSRARELLWISLAGIEVVYLLVVAFLHK
jgi:hypothetical protein